LLHRKRDGEELPSAELRELVLAYARGDVPDYQMAAFCSAVYFRGLSPAETSALTDAMVRSGETLDLGAALGRKVVDKHSTGGVGDKTSLAVGPIVAACGVPFGKMSGRGLGHTGGTLDKLESIPGFRVELTTDEFLEQVRDMGRASIGRTAGREVVCVLTDMDQPLGQAVGNALEIRETIATLRGEGPPDFTELVLSASAHLLALSDLGIDEPTGRERAAAVIDDGSALDRYERWIAAQGGEPAEEALPVAPVVREVVAEGTGYVRAIGAVDIGLAALRLGAGR